MDSFTPRTLGSSVKAEAEAGCEIAPALHVLGTWARLVDSKLDGASVRTDSWPSSPMKYA